MSEPVETTLTFTAHIEDQWTCGNCGHVETVSGDKTTSVPPTVCDTRDLAPVLQNPSGWSRFLDDMEKPHREAVILCPSCTEAVKAALVAQTVTEAPADGPPLQRCRYDCQKCTRTRHPIEPGQVWQHRDVFQFGEAEGSPRWSLLVAVVSPPDAEGRVRVVQCAGDTEPNLFYRTEADFRRDFLRLPYSRDGELRP